MMIPKNDVARKVAKKVLKARGVKLPNLSKKEKKELYGPYYQH